MAKQQPSDHDMILQMHTELIGLGDGGGMVGEHREIREDVSEIKTIIPTLMTKDNCSKTRRSNSKIKFGIWQIIIGTTGIVSGIILAIIFL